MSLGCHGIQGKNICVASGGGFVWGVRLGLRFSATKQKLPRIYQWYLGIKGFSAVAWSQHKIRTTGGRAIVFDEAIKVSIYWGNQWPWHTGVWSFEKGNFWSCSCFLRDSLDVRLHLFCDLYDRGRLLTAFLSGRDHRASPKRLPRQP